MKQGAVFAVGTLSVQVTMLGEAAWRKRGLFPQADPFQTQVSIPAEARYNRNCLAAPRQPRVERQSVRGELAEWLKAAVC